LHNNTLQVFLLLPRPNCITIPCKSFPFVSKTKVHSSS
jgi:hypothetical protein